MRKKHDRRVFGTADAFECVKCGGKEEIIMLCRRKTSRTVCDECQKQKNRERDNRQRKERDKQ